MCTTQNINLGDLQGILKITFRAQYAESNAPLDKKTECFLICRKNGDIKEKQEDFFFDRRVIEIY